MYEQGINSDARITFHNLYNKIFEYNSEKIHRIKLGEKLDRHGYDVKYWNHAHARYHFVQKDDPDKI